MSGIVWALIITVTAMYGVPVTVRLTFDTEAQCEKARATISVQRPAEASVCEPRKAAGSSSTGGGDE